MNGTNAQSMPWLTFNVVIAVIYWVIGNEPKVPDPYLIQQIKSYEQELFSTMYGLYFRVVDARIKSCISSDTFSMVFILITFVAQYFSRIRNFTLVYYLYPEDITNTIKTLLASTPSTFFLNVFRCIHFCWFNFNDAFHSHNSQIKTCTNLFFVLFYWTHSAEHLQATLEN